MPYAGQAEDLPSQSTFVMTSHGDGSGHMGTGLVTWERVWSHGNGSGHMGTGLVTWYMGTGRVTRVTRVQPSPHSTVVALTHASKWPNIACKPLEWCRAAFCGYSVGATMGVLVVLARAQYSAGLGGHSFDAGLS